MLNQNLYQELIEAVNYIKSISSFEPETAIILGTGLGKLGDEIKEPIIIDYQNIPHFPHSTVESHKGKLIMGFLNNEKVLVFQGRFHFYEGYEMKDVVFPVRVSKLLGIKKLLISNAAGGINNKFQKGDLMIINDHINLQPDNPLRGFNDERIGPRWPDLFESYKKEWINQAKIAAEKLNIVLHEGVYVSVPGPNLETPAEYKFLKTIGADAVGMSTVPEVIAAKHCGMDVLAVSVITDLCYPEALKPVSIPEIIGAANKAEPELSKLFSYLLPLLKSENL